MSMLAVKLVEERANKKQNVYRMDNYLPLLCALFGEGTYDPSLNKNANFQMEVEKALLDLGESGTFGMLQYYFIEEYFLQGKSKKEIGKEITKHMDLLLSDLETTAIRFLRHPARSKVLAQYVKKEDETHG